jgi:hypothetical protein
MTWERLRPDHGQTFRNPVMEGLPTIQELSLGEPNLEVEQILFLEFLQPVHDQGQIRRILHWRLDHE